MNIKQMQLANEKVKKQEYYNKWSEIHTTMCIFKPTKERFDRFCKKMNRTYDEMLNDMIDCYQNVKRKEYHDRN